MLSIPGGTPPIKSLIWGMLAEYLESLEMKGFWDGFLGFLLEEDGLLLLVGEEEVCFGGWSEEAVLVDAVS